MNSVCLWIANSLQKSDIWMPMLKDSIIVLYNVTFIPIVQFLLFPTILLQYYSCFCYPYIIPLSQHINCNIHFKTVCKPKLYNIPTKRKEQMLMASMATPLKTVVYNNLSSKYSLFTAFVENLTRRDKVKLL